MPDFTDERRSRPTRPATGPAQASLPREQRAAGQATSGQYSSRAERAQLRPTMGGHPHGKRSSWTLATIIVLAFIVGGLALIYKAWWLFWVCAGVVAVCIPAGKLIGMMDDTVAWGSTVPGDHSPGEGQQATAAAERGLSPPAGPGPEGSTAGSGPRPFARRVSGGRPGQPQV